MKYLLIALLVSCVPVHADSVYLKVGVGYKVDEFQIYLNKEQAWFDDPVTARGELGYRKGSLSFGVSHDSQYLTGWPFNDRSEYYKTELFLDWQVDWEL